MLNKNHLISACAIILVLSSATGSFGQNEKDTLSEKYVFTKKIQLAASPVKDQASTGTCWCFATTSFLESEILRLKGDTTNLSEMYFVRMNYLDKARRYIRLHGLANFGEGGQAHDVLNAVRDFGIMNNMDYSGLANGQEKPDHAELEAVLSGMLNALVKNPSGKLSPNWMDAYKAVLDVYLGKIPENASFDGKPITPEKLRDKYSINPDNYVEITSYLHHPFYSRFILEIPDNWCLGEYYNLPVDELVKIIDHSLESGYTVAWDGDVSDRGFSFKNRVAIVPDVALTDATSIDRARWEKLNEKDRKKQFYSFEKIVPEKNITQEMRQTAFDNYSATDDHLMHITGTATDQNGKRYFTTENSWSAGSNDFGGYLYLSEAYVRLNTIAILIHKDCLTKDIRKKLSIQ